MAQLLSLNESLSLARPHIALSQAGLQHTVHSLVDSLAREAAKREAVHISHRL